MAKPAIKSNDPAWLEGRKADRHKFATRITLRLPAEQKARWLEAAGDQPITAWIMGIVEAALVGRATASTLKGHE